MSVRVKFDKILSPLAPECDAHGGVTLASGNGLSINDLLARFDTVKDQVAFVLINGRQAGYGDKLHDGDVVSLFSVVSGG